MAINKDEALYRFCHPKLYLVELSMKRFLFLTLIVAIVLTGCAAPQNKQEKGARVGALSGAAVGALLGQAIGGDTGATLLGAGLGAIAGGVIGSSVGRNMDNQEAALRKELEAREAANVQRTANTLSLTFRAETLFGVGTDALKPGAFDEITRVSRVLNQYPDTNIMVAGHTDSTGSEEHNQRLSERRAANVKNGLVDHGVHPNRISTIGFGESAPLANNDTESGRQLNRRVVITITPRKA